MGKQYMFVNRQPSMRARAKYLTLYLIALLTALVLFSLSFISSKDSPYLGYDDAIAQSPNQSTTADENVGAGMSLYQNTTYGIEMQYPSGWQVGEFNNSAANPTKLIVGFLSPIGVQRATDRNPESILVGVENLSSSNMGLAPYTTLQLSLLSEGAQGFKLVESLPTTLANMPAHQIVYTQALEQFNLKKMQVWTVKDGIAYLFIYSADEADYPSQLPTVKKMLDSFRIINPAPKSG
jgi:hypothetical protein